MPSVLMVIQEGRPLVTGCDRASLWILSFRRCVWTYLKWLKRRRLAGRGRNGERDRERGRHLSLWSGGKKIWGGGGGGGWWEWGGEGCCWHEAGALCFTEPLASFCLCLSLPLADVNNNSASAERTQVSTIVLLWMDLGEGGQGSQGHLSHLSHPQILFFFYIHTDAPFHWSSSRTPTPTPSTAASPSLPCSLRFIIIAQCFVKTFQRSCTSSVFWKINILCGANRLAQPQWSVAAFHSSSRPPPPKPTKQTLCFVLFFNSRGCFYQWFCLPRWIWACPGSPLSPPASANSAKTVKWWL